ncbi:MAG: prolyl oligopeptidase family serine peptidase [Ginsengibacter sp.]
MKKRFSDIINGTWIITICLFTGITMESHRPVLIGFSFQNADTTKPRNDSCESNWSADFKLAAIKSPVDGELQKAYFYKSKSTRPQPLIVSLHSWSWDYRQYDTISILSKEKEINYIHPNFRGQNWTKDACCSDLVISDIDDAIDYAIKNGNVDTSKIYVIGRSGGGYATISAFMKSRHRIKKFSSWVPLTDLVSWYDETRIRKLSYADNILICTHSANGKLNKEEAIQKSPIYWTTPAEKLRYAKLEIFDGIYDGLENNGPIPITHSINFYNKLLRDLKVSDSSKYISDAEKLKLLELRKPLGGFGKIADRDICLMKEYGNIRITIFTGGHEMLQEYAFSELIK